MTVPVAESTSRTCAHEGGIGPGIGVAVGVAQSREDLPAFSVFVPRDGVLIRVAFHPGGGITRGAVLPASEPQQDDVQVVGSGVAEGAIQRGEIELALLGLGPAPAHADQGCVDVRFGQFGPSGARVFGRRRGIVQQLTRQGQVRLAVNDEVGYGAFLLQMGNGRAAGGRLGLGARCHQGQRAIRAKEVKYRYRFISLKYCKA